ncbi:oleate hydratase [Streptomyces sp. Ag109_O5-1]|uniref:oleate hydratase n=1 Tax=Streptomyces sp. Ag109_O5-1 TaxID=1938851 RepID=UPI0021A5F561|nr:oleate hydratase [Streptomyces sp. Ag109_O5-1]
MTDAPQQSRAYFVGGGIASLAAAAFLIRDGGFPGQNIHILEELPVTGGSMDGRGGSAGYVSRGGRMLEDEATPACGTSWRASRPSPTRACRCARRSGRSAPSGPPTPKPG